MSHTNGLAPRSEKGLLTPDNCVVTLIDLQPQMIFGVSSADRQSIVNYNVALSKAARVFGVPTVLSTVETKAFSGYMWPQVQAVFPGQTAHRTINDERLGRRELHRSHQEDRPQEDRACRALD